VQYELSPAPARCSQIGLSWGRIWKFNLADAGHLKPCSVRLSFQIRPQLTTAIARRELFSLPCNDSLVRRPAP
jgi:hypothetical protein